MFEKTFCIYSPEAHGFQTGSNNGNYAEHISFRYQEGKFHIKSYNSAEGDLLPWVEWEEVSAAEFLSGVVKAAVDEERELKEVGSL